MPVWSDMNGFPEGGFPVLANANDMITLNQLYLEPLRINQYQIDVLGNNRLAGALVIAGALSGVTSLSMGGALSGVTTIGANNTVTLSHATAPLTLSGASAQLLLTGLYASIGNLLQRVNKIFAKDLDLVNRPTVGNDYVALVSDIERLITSAVADGTYTVGIGETTNGTITTADGIITAVQEAT